MNPPPPPNSSLVHEQLQWIWENYKKMSFTSFNKGLNAMIYSLTSTHNFKTKDKINPISTPCVVNMALQKQNLIKLW